MLYIMKYSFIWNKNKKGVKYNQKYLKVFTKYWTQQTTSMKKNYTQSFIHVWLAQQKILNSYHHYVKNCSFNSI